MKRRTIRSAAAVLALVLAGCQDRDLPTAAPEGPAYTQQPASPVVNSLLDDGDGSCTDARCTLRDAITFAAPGATITFASGLAGTITLDEVLEVDKDLTIAGPGASSLTLSRPEERAGILEIRPDVTATVSGLAFTGSQGGAAILNGGTLMLRNSVVSRNVGSERRDIPGGGIFNAGVLTLENSTVSGNLAFLGGGIFNGGMLTLRNSTMVGNAARFSGGAILNAYTGMIILANSVHDNSAAERGDSERRGVNVTLENSTISGNFAGVSGGGIANNGILVLRHTTLSDNEAPVGGALLNGLAGEVLLWNSILANSTEGADCHLEEEGSLPIILDGYNLVEDRGNCTFGIVLREDDAPGTLTEADPLLGPLAANGGPTWTHALLPGSPAIAAIPAGTNGCGTDFTADQRGVTRPQGSACDIGAFELEPDAAPTYTFVGFTAPVENPGVLNVAKAGQTIPLKWRLLRDGQPVRDLSGVTVKVSDYNCGPSTSSDPVGESTAGKSGLQNLGEGYYQFNWQTPRGYAGFCKRLTLELQGIDLDPAPQALFRFTR